MVVARERVRIEEASRAVDGAVVAVEAALQRPVVFVSVAARPRGLGDVPLADRVGAITGWS